MLDKPASSATAIRKALINMSPKEISEYMPSYSAGILEEAFAAGMGPVYMEDFTQPVLCALRSISTGELSGIIDVNEGLEHKIKKAAAMSGSINELIDNIKSKRYTETRIKRILVHSLLRMQKKELYLFKAAGGPLYIRVLGFSEKGKKLLSMIKKTCNLPIITNVGDYRKYGSELF
jgi:predicted nucleotidyltransferase